MGKARGNLRCGENEASCPRGVAGLRAQRQLTALLREQQRLEEGAAGWTGRTSHNVPSVAVPSPSLCTLMDGSTFDQSLISRRPQLSSSLRELREARKLQEGSVKQQKLVHEVEGKKRLPDREGQGKQRAQPQGPQRVLQKLQLRPREGGT